MWHHQYGVIVSALLALDFCFIVSADANGFPNSLFQSSGYDWGIYGLHPRQTFKSFDLRPPLVNFLQWDEECDFGYTLLTPRGTLVWKPAPIILDGRGELVWMDDRFGEVMNLNVQEYKGEQYLTFWTGTFDEGCGKGSYYMIDSSYQVFREFSASQTMKGDFHEIKLTTNGTALVTIYELTPADLSPFGIDGQGWINDGVFQEIDISTGQVLFEWRASNHYSLQDSFEHIPTSSGSHPNKPWDFFHINSIDKDESGNYYISSRFMHSITCIAPNGEIRWVLGGRRNHFADLSDGKAISWSWQHHMTLQPNNTIALFDNAGHLKFSRHDGPARAMVLALDTGNLTAELLKTFEYPGGRGVPSQGSMQYNTETGGAFVGWGYHGAYSDFSSDGEIICDAHIAPSLIFDLGWVHSYRTYRTTSWVGRPSFPPSIYMESNADTAYVSWNGATEIVYWVLQLADVEQPFYDDKGHYRDAGNYPKNSFESAINLPRDVEFTYMRIAALDKHDKVLGYTAVVDRRMGSAPRVLAPRLRLQKIVADLPLYLLTVLSLVGYPTARLEEEEELPKQSP
ncbi:hypothetical protein TruAng_010396 [Truncatella angustata]|nr:hypothetical protein TruAng_010396 [Truncatella angustata]